MTADQERDIEIGGLFEDHLNSIVGKDIAGWMDSVKLISKNHLRHPKGDSALDKNEQRDYASGILDFIDQYNEMIKAKLTAREIALDESTK